MGDILNIMRRFGTFLAAFHHKYGSVQHGDLHESNVFYDETSGKFALVDLDLLGSTTSEEEGDFEQSSHRLSLLSDVYGEELGAKCVVSFEEGYKLLKRFRLVGM